MRLVLVLAVGGLLAGCRAARLPWAPREALDRTVRQTTSGPVRGGVTPDGALAWMGIPYAAAPVGELRWRGPRPAEPWTEVRTAVDPGPPCMQLGSPLAGGRNGEMTGSEDCLWLTVWAPDRPAGEVKGLPVMVWIHGGGNSIGTAGFYDGSVLARTKDVVVVALQYRLGPLGWFRHRALREAGGVSAVEASGNFGTLDLVHALGWVRDNAAAFGGDPGNVTVFGESAGGFNVYSLLVSPLARGLFHRAVVQSGGLWAHAAERAEAPVGSIPDAHPASSSEVLARVLVSAGRAVDRDAALRFLDTTPPGELAGWMRSLSPAELYAGYPRMGGLAMLEAPLVFRDGVVLPAEDWLTTLATPGGWNQVPVILGTNRDEMKLFMFLDPKRTDRLFGVIPRVKDPDRYEVGAEVTSRLWKLTGVDDPARAMLRSGATEVYTYRWDWADEPTLAGADLSRILGAAHGLEVPFVFGKFEFGPLNVIFTEENQFGRVVVSGAMTSYWTHFAHTGSPGTGRKGKLPGWTRFDPDGEATHMIFDVPAGGGMRMLRTVETREGIIADALATPRLDSLEARCGLLAEVVAAGRSLERADYEAIPECQPFPLPAVEGPSTAGR